MIAAQFAIGILLLDSAGKCGRFERVVRVILAIVIALEAMLGAFA